MAIYYQITEPKIEEHFDNKEKVCLYLRANKISKYTVFMKDDATMPSFKGMGFNISSLAPMNEDITSEIKETLAYYGEMEKG